MTAPGSVRAGAFGVGQVPPAPASAPIDAIAPGDPGTFGAAGPRLSRGRLVGFYAVTLAAGLSLGLTAPLTAVFAVELGASPFAASLSVASLTAVVLVLDVLGTRLLPFLEPRRSITIGMLLWTVGSFASAVAPTFELMAAARLLQGVGLALYASAGPQLAIKLAGAERVGTALGRFQAAMTFGAAFAPLTGGALADVVVPGAGSDIGLRIAFGVCGLIALVCSAAALILLPTIRPVIRPRFSLPRLPGLFRRRPMLALGMGALGQGARGALAATIIPLVVADGLGLGGITLGVLLTSMYAVEVLTMAFGGAWSDRRGRRRFVLLGTASGLIGTTVLGVAVHTGSTAVLFVAAVPLGIAGGCMLSLLPAVLVDLAGSPEVGLSATRISRDLGFTLCTVGAGAAISLAEVTGGLALVLGLFVAVSVIMIIVGETRWQHRHALVDAGVGDDARSVDRR